MSIRYPNIGGISREETEIDKHDIKTKWRRLTIEMFKASLFVLTYYHYQYKNVKRLLICSLYHMTCESKLLLVDNHNLLTKT